MWIPLLEKEFDLHLVQLRSDGSFHIPVLKQTVSSAPFDVDLIEYHVCFKKTDEGNELSISKKGKLAKRLRFDGEWSRYQEQEERAANQSTPVPGAKRKQLSLSDELTMEQMWRENYEFRLRAYSFLQDKWEEADEFGIHVPNRHGHRSLQILYGGLLPLAVAFTFYFVFSSFINVKKISDDNETTLNKVVADARKLNSSEVEKNNKLLDDANQSGNVVPFVPPDDTNENKDDLDEKEDEKKPQPLIDDNQVVENKNNPGNMDDDDKSQPKDDIPGKNPSTPPKKVEPEIPPPKATWTAASVVSNLEVGDRFNIGVKVIPNGKIPAKIYGHFGPWKEGESKLKELKNAGDLSFTITKEQLTDVKTDADGLERGTIAYQILVTNNESPYEGEEPKAIKPKYRSAVLFREKEPIRVFVNKKPVFSFGRDVAKVNSGPIQHDNPSRNIIVQGGKATEIYPNATDPDGEKTDTLIYEYKKGNQWTIAENGKIPLDTTKSGKFSVTVRAKDKAKRISNEHQIPYSVNFPPKLESIATMPNWPVPGGPLRMLVAANDPEGDDVSTKIKILSNGKTITPDILDHFDSEKKKPVEDGFVLFHWDEIDSEKIQLEIQLNDDRLAVADKISKELEFERPKIIKPNSPGKKITNSLGLEFVEIPPGEFSMGSPASEAGRGENEILHGVKITKPFFMQTTEFPDPVRIKLQFPLQKYKRDVAPATHMPYSHAQHFCNYLNELPEEMKAGRFYRLPTEAEWEYACRAGGQSPFNVQKDSGRFLTSKLANIDSKYGGWPKGQKKYEPNLFGLYDMHGNAHEFCIDKFEKDFYWTAPISDPVNRDDSITVDRVIRGGSIDSKWSESRSASRASVRPTHLDSDIGFRLVCEIEKPRTPLPFKFEIAPDEKYWLWNAGSWNVEEGKLIVNSQAGSSRNNHIVLKNDVADFEFSCSFQIKNTADSKKPTDCVLGIVPRGRLISSAPPKFNGKEISVTVGNNNWGSIENARGGTIKASKESLQLLEQTKIGKLNTLRIVAKGKKLTVWVNGIKTTEKTVNELAEVGKFAFFWRGYDYKKSLIEIQNVKFTTR